VFKEFGTVIGAFFLYISWGSTATGDSDSQDSHRLAVIKPLVGEFCPEVVVVQGLAGSLHQIIKAGAGGMSQILGVLCLEELAIDVVPDVEVLYVPLDESPVMQDHVELGNFEIVSRGRILDSLLNPAYEEACGDAVLVFNFKEEWGIGDLLMWSWMFKACEIWAGLMVTGPTGAAGRTTGLTRVLVAELRVLVISSVSAS
jgi:hypothetical protein